MGCFRYFKTSKTKKPKFAFDVLLLLSGTQHTPEGAFVTWNSHLVEAFTARGLQVLTSRGGDSSNKMSSQSKILTAPIPLANVCRSSNM